MPPLIDPLLKMADLALKLLRPEVVPSKDADSVLVSLLEELDRSDPRRIRVERLSRGLWKIALPPSLLRRVFSLPYTGSTQESIIWQLRASTWLWTWKEERIVLTWPNRWRKAAQWLLALAGTVGLILGLWSYVELLSAFHPNPQVQQWQIAVVMILIPSIALMGSVYLLALAGRILAIERLAALLDHPPDVTPSAPPEPVLELSE